MPQPERTRVLGFACRAGLWERGYVTRGVAGLQQRFVHDHRKHAGLDRERDGKVADLVEVKANAGPRATCGDQ